MKKLFALLTCAMCVGITFAGDWIPVKIVVPASSTNVYTDVELSQTFGDKCLSIDHFTATVVSGSGTGTVSFASVDHGIETAIVTSGNLNTTTLYSNYPARSSVTEAVVGYAVVTGDVVVTGTYLNTTTNKQDYLLRTIRVRVNQPAASGSTVYNAAIFTK